MTTMEIAAEHGVSRQTIHTYRRSGAFPQPVEGEGSTRVRFREDEVAAFFAVNPKQPGKKRSSPTQQQGDPVTTTTARDRLVETLKSPGLVGLDAEDAAELVDAYRADVLRVAADRLDESETLRDLTDDHMQDVNAAANELRRMADESVASDG
jgi:predicted DNA-binding transcriptional regulator AlpA